MKTHTLSGQYLRKMLLEALKHGKDARYIVRFEVAGIEADITLRFYRRK